jgi:DNA-directed RNA polymerase specialized sigma24 family protein
VTAPKKSQAKRKGKAKGTGKTGRPRTRRSPHRAVTTGTVRRPRTKPVADPTAHSATDPDTDTDTSTKPRPSAAPPPRDPAAPAAVPPPSAGTPAGAFDALYARAATALLRQVELLTGDPLLAHRAVLHAFGLAWQRWPEVACDADPTGWVRAAAYEYALAPWRRWVPRHRTAVPPVAPGGVEAALVDLPPIHRRSVLLHDGLGLGLRETAVETEASTAATAARIVHAREALTAAVPDLGGDEDVAARLGALLAEGPDREPPRGSARVRDDSERGALERTVGACALTALIAVAAVLTVLTGPGTAPSPASGPHPAGGGAGQHDGAGASPARDRTHTVTR